MKETQSQEDINFDAMVSSIPDNLSGLKELVETYSMKDIAERMDALLYNVHELPPECYEADDAFLFRLIRDVFNRIAIDNGLEPYIPTSKRREE